RLGRPAVPCHRQGLQAAIGPCDEVLLNRVDAERVGDVELGRSTVLVLGTDPERLALPRERGLGVTRNERRRLEVAEYPVGRRGGHGLLVLRLLPGLMLGSVTAGAGRAADVLRRSNGGGIV